VAFVRSGFVDLVYGQTGNVGYEGDGWSRTAVSSTFAYYLGRGSGGGSHSSGYYRTMDRSRQN